jgi:penicillin G amidase
MRFLKFLASAFLTAGLVYVLSNPLTIKGVSLPALGKLFNPFSGFWQNAEGAFSFGEKNELQIPSLKSKVKVVYDDRDVPHIFADNTADVLRAQGYIHAQNRLFQMDLTAHAMAGRLSEMVGERALENDKMERRHGTLRAAEASVEAWKKNTEMYQWLEAYVEGVNAYIATLTEKTMPVEYKILGATPEKWSVLSTSLFYKGMCRTLARGEMDAEMSNTLSKLGEKEFNQLFPERHPKTMPIVPSGTSWNFKPVASNIPSVPNTSTSQIIDFQDNVTKEAGIGSNNWAVAGSKTTSGKAILAGDPHLNMTLPAIWYECQMTTPEFNTYGVSLPGIPFVVIGFNNDIAWTQTNAQHDVADWFRLEWKDATKKEYKLDGKYVAVEERVEEFHVKGKGIEKEVVKWTKFGPVAFEDGSNPRNDLAFHWVAAEGNPNDMATFYLMAKAKNFDDFSSALKDFACPMQNFAFACKNGDIAIRTQGWLPIRKRGGGRMISDGTTSSSLWSGYAPFEHMPYVKNPKSGYVVSANQNTTDASYPYYYTSRTFDNFRSRRINKLLSEDKKFSLDDIRKMQYDNYGLDAEEFLPIIMKRLEGVTLGAPEQAAIEELKKWNFHYTKDSKAAMIFDAWMANFQKQTWDELWFEDILNPVTIPPSTKMKKLNPFAMPQTWRTMQLLEDDVNSKHFDNMTTPEVENGSMILISSLTKALADIVLESTVQLNPNLDYGAYKKTRIEHIAKLPGFAHKLNADGSANAVNATKTTAGPSWRMVVEMGDTPHAYVVYPGGQSGNPGNKSSEEFIERWANGEHYEAIFMKSADEKQERLKKIIEFSQNNK